MSTRVYAMGCNGHIKFGISNSPKQRKATLQTAVPFEVKLLSQTDTMDREMAFALEEAIHSSLAKFHTRGEWFASAPRTLAVADLLIKKPPIDLLELFCAWAEEAAKEADRI